MMMTKWFDILVVPYYIGHDNDGALNPFTFI